MILLPESYRSVSTLGVVSKKAEKKVACVMSITNELLVNLGLGGERNASILEVVSRLQYKRAACVKRIMKKLMDQVVLQCMEVALVDLKTLKKTLKLPAV